MKWCTDIQSALLLALRRQGHPDLKVSDLCFFVPMDLAEGDFAIHLGRYVRNGSVRESVLTALQAELGAAHRCYFSGDYLHVQVPLEVLLGAMADELASYLPVAGLEPPYPLQVPAFAGAGAVEWRTGAVRSALGGLWQAVYASAPVSREWQAELPPEVLKAALEQVEREDLSLSGMSLAGFAGGVLQLQLLALPARGESPADLTFCFAGRSSAEAEFLLGLWRMRQFAGTEKAAVLSDTEWREQLVGERLAALGPADAWRGVARACLGLAVQLPQLVYPGKLPWLMRLLLQNHTALQKLWQVVRLEEAGEPEATAMRKHLLHARQCFLEALLQACAVPFVAAPAEAASHSSISAEQ